MLAGSTPFTGPTVQAMISKRFTDPVPSVRSARPAVPEVVDQALSKSLAKARGDRWSTAAQFAQALAVPTGTTPPGSTPVGHAATPSAKSIAVLPFVDMSPQHDQEYFCEGMAEDLINALMKVEELRVASRTSAFGFKGKDDDIRKIGEQLGVSTVLGGSVRKAGNRLRITAQLISVGDGYHVWSERYDRDMEDIFAIQDEIAENIAKALRVVLTETTRQALAKPATADIEAYDYYLRGRQYFHQHRRKGFESARRMFARATECDPGFARAYAGSADCCSFLYMYWEAREADLEMADTASRKALDLDPDLAEAHAARGLAISLRKEYQDARAEFETAIRLNPKLFEPYYFYARTCFVEGKLEDAARLYEKASEVRPEDYQAPALLGTVYQALRRQPEVEAACHRALQLIERHLELYPDDTRALCLGSATAIQIGRREQAVAWAERALAIDADEPLILYNVACAYALLGLADEAIGCLEKAINHGGGHREWLKNDTDLDPLRGLPRFEALLASS
jgi:adenylate cyclase